MPKEVEPIRTPEEAWNMAVDEKELMLYTVNRFMKGSRPSWYRWEPDLWRQELESIGWEAFYNACLYWDPSRGRLSTYAVPTIQRRLSRHLQRTIRAGGNSRVRGKHSEITEKFPSIFSLGDLEGEQRDRLGEYDEVWSYEDVTPPVWSDLVDNSFEDRVIDEADGERFLTQVETVVDGMSEPHRTVFRLVHLEDPSHDRSQYSLARGSGSTLREVGSRLGIDKSRVGIILDEAEEYVRFQLEAKGGRDAKDSR